MNKIDSSSTARGPLFRPLHDTAPQVRLELDGQPTLAHAQETVAGLLLRLASPESFRPSDVPGEARAPVCMMGICFECLVEIDGQGNQQGCLVAVRDGMRIRRQSRVPV
ncbi:(2Fe-2S)-binding protein [Dongia sp.]|uniref:(2Fe-2S)-binding protein n=1 Tax=Dongia sp. TaxID=1977262 RepID=UPI0035B0AAC2